MRRLTLLFAVLGFGAPLIGAASAQAVVVDMNAIGQTTVPYNQSDQSGYYGVALIPGTLGNLGIPKIPTVTSSAPCMDPRLTADFGGPVLPSNGLCYHGGAVMHANETFDLAWDPLRRDWATTRDYLEQYLRNVADASGTFSSSYALTPQYTDATGRAANQSRYAGGCIDYGNPGGFTCQFGNTTGSGAGNNYPTSGCPPAGTNQFAEGPNGFGDAPNDVCLTDAQIRGELAAVLGQEGISGRTQPGYTPFVVLMTPPGVVDCLDAAGSLCSANSRIAAPAPVVSTATTGGHIPPGTFKVEITYVTAGGESLASGSTSVTTTAATTPTGPASTASITISSPPPINGATGWYAYMTQAGGPTFTRQQPAGVPTPIGSDLTLTQPPTSSGAPVDSSTAPSFCSYHSQASVGGVNIAYEVLPWVAWWNSSTDCTDPDAPSVPIGGTAQQDELAAGGQLVSPLNLSQIPAIVDPAFTGWFALDGTETNDHGCVPLAGFDGGQTLNGTGYFLQNQFNNGGVLESDPNAPWCAPNVHLAPAFVVPSAVDQGDVVEFDGSKTVSTLAVPGAAYSWSFGDGATAVGPSVTHTYSKGGTFAVKLMVTDRGGNTAMVSNSIVVLGPGGTAVPPPTTVPVKPGPTPLRVRLALMPQSLSGVLRQGIAVRVSSNQAADGIATLSISRRAAKQAHLRVGRGVSVVISRGTVSGIRTGTVSLHFRMAYSVATKLAHLRRLTLTIHLALVGAAGTHLAVDVAGSY